MGLLLNETHETKKKIVLSELETVQNRDCLQQCGVNHNIE
jgi:hypothetical protein